MSRAEENKTRNVKKTTTKKQHEEKNNRGRYGNSYTK